MGNSIEIAYVIGSSSELTSVMGIHSKDNHCFTLDVLLLSGMNHQMAYALSIAQLFFSNTNPA